MIAEHTGTERANSKTIERWSAYLEELYARIAPRFLRPEVRARAYRYLTGLLGEVTRKNGWQMAEAIGEAKPRGGQHLLNDARWDPDAVRDDLRDYVVEHLGDEESGVLIVDETGFLKKGEKSVGVARQYTGTAGKRENAQVGVFLVYASKKGAAFIDRALYLPHEWAEDAERRAEAGVPEEVNFATKGKSAKEMLRRALEAGVPARWVVADTVYGTARGLRGWLEKREHSYVLAVPGTQGVYYDGCQRQARTVAQRLPEEAWFRASAGAGSKGDRFYDWAWVPLPNPDAAGAGRWLLMRRSIEDRAELAYYLAYGPAETPVRELTRIAGRRWAVEECFEQAKGEVGLDEYEVRKWDGWHRHVTLCMLAHAYLAVLRSVAQVRKTPAKGGSRGGNPARADPADRAGSAASDPGDDGTYRGAGVPAGVVAVASSSPGGSQALSPGKSRCKVRSSSRTTARSRAARARDDGNARFGTDGCLSHRRELGAPQTINAAAEATHRAAEKRPPHGFGRDAVGFRNRRLVEGSAGRRVRAVADGLRALSRVAQGRTLAADSRSAWALTMRPMTHSRVGSGTVGLETVRKGVRTTLPA